MAVVDEAVVLLAAARGDDGAGPYKPAPAGAAASTGTNMDTSTGTGAGAGSSSGLSQQVYGSAEVASPFPFSLRRQPSEGGGEGGDSSQQRPSAAVAPAGGQQAAPKIDRQVGEERRER